jgi:aryl-alcohol dehydrogenase-like predicted oxidoreductase
VGREDRRGSSGDAARCPLEFRINFFDTADTLREWRGERQLAEAFRGKRAQVLHSTKIGYDIHDPGRRPRYADKRELPQKFDRDYMRFAR